MFNGGVYALGTKTKRTNVMIAKISVLIAAALILGSTAMASAANHPRHNRVMQLENGGTYAAPAGTAGSYGGYSLDPHTRYLQDLADKYPGSGY
jgi:hypothetical protein